MNVTRNKPDLPEGKIYISVYSSTVYSLENRSY